MTTKTRGKMTTKINKNSLNIAAEMPGDDLIFILIDRNSEECTVCTLPEHGETTIVTSRGSGYKIKQQQEELI